jgi:hypothetical protein
MTKRGPRPVVFVCVAVNPDKPEDPISIPVQAVSQAEAAILFLEKTKLKARNIHGPYLPKRAQVMKNTRTLKFTNEQKRAIYDGWEVNAMFLKEPENHAYLLLLRRVDGKKQQQPKGTIIVPVSDLRFI